MKATEQDFPVVLFIKSVDTNLQWNLRLKKSF